MLGDFRFVVAALALAATFVSVEDLKEYVGVNGRVREKFKQFCHFVTILQILDFGKMAQFQPTADAPA